MRKVLILLMFVMLNSIMCYAEEFDINIQSEVIDIEEQPFDNSVQIILPSYVLTNEIKTETKYVLQDTVVLDSGDINNVVADIKRGEEIQLVEFKPDYSKIYFNNDYYLIPSNCIGSKEELDHIFTSVFEAMTPQEEDEFLKMLYLECCNEPFEGKVACVEETCRRVVSPKWPNSVHDVIFQRGQFSTARRIKNVVEGQPYKPYGDHCVDLNPLREALNHVKTYGYTVLPAKAAELGYNISEKKDYVFWATYKANGTHFIKIGHHYFGMGNV